MGLMGYIHSKSVRDARFYFYFCSLYIGYNNYLENFSLSVLYAFLDHINFCRPCNPETQEIIRKVREAQGLTIEELASKMMEKSALLRKIECEELIPEDAVRKKLETILNIKLTEKVSSQVNEETGLFGNYTWGM